MRVCIVCVPLLLLVLLNSNLHARFKVLLLFMTPFHDADGFENWIEWKF